MLMKESKYTIVVQQAHDTVTLYNTRTGMLVRVPTKAYRHLQQASLAPPAEKPYLAPFVRRGFCVPAPMDESQQFYAQYQRFQHNTTMEELSLTVAVTMNCNYRCLYCFEDGVSADTMRADTAEQLCIFIENTVYAHPECKAISIKWFGGEPLLALPIIRRITERIHGFCRQQEIAYRSRLMTNGALLTQETLDFFMQHHLVSAQIAMDGACEAYCHWKGTTPEHYRKVRKIIRDCCTQVHINLRLNAHPANFPSLMELATELYQEEAVREHISLYLAPVESSALPVFTPAEFADAQLAFLQHLFDLGWYTQINHALPRMRTAPCYNLQRHNFTIDPQGRIYACEADLGRPDAHIATLHTPFAELAKKKETLAEAYNVSLSSECKHCVFFPLCFSGCPRQRRTGEACLAFQRQTLGILKLIACIPG